MLEGDHDFMQCCFPRVLYVSLLSRFNIFSLYIVPVGFFLLFFLSCLDGTTVWRAG